MIADIVSVAKMKMTDTWWLRYVMQPGVHQATTLNACSRWILSSDSGFWILDSGFWFWILSSEFWVLILDSGFWILDSEFWFWILDSEFWIKPIPVFWTSTLHHWFSFEGGSYFRTEAYSAGLGRDQLVYLASPMAESETSPSPNTNESKTSPRQQKSILSPDSSTTALLWAL